MLSRSKESSMAYLGTLPSSSSCTFQDPSNQPALPLLLPVALVPLAFSSFPRSFFSLRVFFSKPAVSRPICSPKALPSSCFSSNRPRVDKESRKEEEKKKKMHENKKNLPPVEGVYSNPFIAFNYNFVENLTPSSLSSSYNF